MKPYLLPHLLSVLCCAAGVSAGCGAAETTDEPVPTPDCPAIVEDRSRTVPDAPNGAAECASGDCNYQTQEGCPESRACRPQFNASEPVVTPGCEPAGDTPVGMPCSASADCVRGAYCVAEAGAEGICRKQCCGGDWSSCDAGESCIRSLEVRAGGQLIPAQMSLCFPVGTCDLFDPDSCAAEGHSDRECKIVDPTGAVACAPRSSAELGDPCSPPEVCSQGLSCVGGFCTKLCAWEACAAPTCGESEGSCVHFDRNPPGVGECTLGR